MMGYRPGDFDKMTLDDWWTLHEKGYEREIEDFALFALYAISPSTEQVVDVAPTKYSERTGQLWAYGPDGMKVSLRYQYPLCVSLQVKLMMLTGSLTMRGKLKKG